MLALAQTKRLIVTVEEAYLAGGFGSAVLELLEENGLQDKVRVVRMGIPDRLVTHGDAKLLLAKYGLDADGIYTRVKESIDVLDDRRAKPQKVGRVALSTTPHQNRARTAETDGRVVLMHDMVVVSSAIMPARFLLRSFLQPLSHPAFFFLFGPQLLTIKRLDKSICRKRPASKDLEQNGIRNNERRNRP